MEKLRTLVIVGLLFIGALANSQSIKDVENFKVMTYNIWNGFDWGKDEDRQKKMITWIKSKNPDVLALQELCGYTQEKLQADAKKWGHNYAVILKEKGYPVGLTSNKPIKLKEKVLEGLWHGMLHVETWGIDFFVVHLSPADRDFRYKEAKIISEKVQNADNKNYLVLGDFNAHSPFDGDHDLSNASRLDRIRASDAKNEKYNNLMDEQFDYSVMASFLSLPLVDLTQRFVSVTERFTFPAEVLVGTHHTKESVVKNRVRIDYILVSRSLGKLSTKTQVFNSAETTLLSDHFPVMAEFNLNLNDF